MAKKTNSNKGLIQISPKRWAVDCYINGRRIRTTVGSHGAAKTYLEKLKTIAKEKRHVPELHRQRTTFKKLTEEYAKYADLHHRRKGDDLPRLKTWVEAFGEMEPETIRPSQVEAVMERLKAEGAAPATIQRRLVVLKAVFNRAVRNELITRNPISTVRPPKANNIIVRYLTEAQETRLFEALPLRLRPLVIVALHTGCRQGELLKLRWQDIDFESGTFFLRDTKAGEARRVRMNSLVLGVLSDLPGKEGGTVFKDTHGGPMDPGNLRREFHAAVVRAQLTPFRFHDLRHTFASRLAMNGANDRTLQELLGHKTASMILRYAHLGPSHLWAALEGLTGKSTAIKTDTRSEVEKEEKV